MSQFRILDHNYVFEDIGITAYTEDASFPVANLQKFSPSKVYRTEGAQSQRITFDLLTPDAEIDTAVILFDRESDILISPSGTIALQANPTNHWSSPAYSVNLTIDDINHCATKFMTSPESYRFWRIFVDDAANALNYFEIAKVFLSKSTRLSQMPSRPFEVQTIEQSEINDSPYGVRFADLYPYRRKANFPHRLLSEADKITLQKIYQRCGKVKPVMLCLDPAEAYFSDGNENMFYGYFDNDLSTVNSTAAYFDADITIKEAL